MNFFEQAKHALREQFAQFSQLAKSGEIFCLQTPLASDLNLLAWLNGNARYPQAYLHFRDEDRAFAALGAVEIFQDLNAAQAFVSQTDFPLIGGVQFNGAAQFILPQALISAQGKTREISLFVSKESDLETLLSEIFENSTALFAQIAPPAKQQIAAITPQANQQTWASWINRALNAIKTQKLSKIVLANETSFALTAPLGAKALLAQSERENQGCYHFLWAENAQSQFIGSTPERLFLVENQQFTTEALAGTAPVGKTAQETAKFSQWLVNDPKNLAENWLVVEDISNNINDLIENLQVGDVAIKPLRKVQHLVRKITGNLRVPNLSYAALLRAIHPTAAVSGLPQQIARDEICQIETFERSWYAGALGVLQKHRAEFCVAIRSAFVEEMRVRVFAGAGIVAGSNALDEWQEIERKAAGLVSLFAHH